MTNEAQRKAKPEQLKRQLEFQIRLSTLIQNIQKAENFSDVMPEIEAAPIDRQDRCTNVQNKTLRCFSRNTFFVEVAAIAGPRRS